jgi:molybdate transport system regulatory protein
MRELRPCLKLWVEAEGRIVMSDYRVRLLEYIDETGSLARAAANMNLSYRRAWGKVKELEENLGFPLVQSEVGGPGGGQTTLTPAGEAFVRAYARFQQRMHDQLQVAFDEEMEAMRAVEPASPGAS